MTRALILVDVDGVLNKLSFEPGPGFVSYHANGFKVNCSKQHGSDLLDLARRHDAEIVWCTMWEDEANEHISPLVGLPSDLRHVPFNGLHRLQSATSFKQPCVAQWLDENEPNTPAIWFDDDVYNDAFQWAQARTLAGVPTYASKCDPLVGLSRRAISRADRFLRRSLGNDSLPVYIDNSTMV